MGKIFLRPLSLKNHQITDLDNEVFRHVKDFNTLGT